MDSNYYEIDQFLSIQRISLLHDKYSDVPIIIRSLPDKLLNINFFQ